VADKDRPHWIDCLDEKHECFPYGEAKKIAIHHDGRPIQVIVPDWVSEFAPLAVAETNGLLMLVGRLDKLWDDRPLGVMLVAKKRRKDQYEVGVWHELYPWALKHLGFVPADS
jgi:hypothetical protein